MCPHYTGIVFLASAQDHGLATKLQKMQNRAAHIIAFWGYDVPSAEIYNKTIKLGRAFLKKETAFESINV